MIKQSKTLKEVKENIFKLKDKSVNVTVNLGRNKLVKFAGKLTATYPALFTVTPEDKAYKGKTSYSYAEILCGSVFISLKDAN